MGILNGVVNIINNIAIPTGQSIIKDRLDESVKKTIITSSINLALFIVGLTLVIFTPFGYKPSYLISAILFISFLLWTLFRLTKNTITIYPIVKNIFISKSIRKGLAQYIRERWPKVIIGETAISFISIFSKDAKRIPTLEKIIDLYIKAFINYIIVYLLSILTYFLLITCILKPVLLNQFANTSMLEIYLFPFLGIWKVI